MRINRMRKLKIFRRKIKKIVINFIVIMPLFSIVIGHVITDLVILPNYYR